jgi:hypothetical protein
MVNIECCIWPYLDKLTNLIYTNNCKTTNWQLGMQVVGLTNSF